uniref:Uncharacterized protein n=1 Tax=Nicotiana tabacum TaxID=4097 RepID=A0A1S4BUW1_TOBAC|nr:PREDICTED: uncharacterized protein LOC107812154 [Nicotiana tabacum]
MRSLSEEKNEGSEDDYDNMALESFIRARSSQVVPPALVVDIDDEVEEEPGSLVRKSSKKLTVPKSKKESFVSEMDLSKVEGEKSCEKEAEKSGEELVEQVSEKKVSEKSGEKRKSARQSVKRNASASEEPGSSKRAKAGATQDAGREKLRIQKECANWRRSVNSNSGHIYSQLTIPRNVIVKDKAVQQGERVHKKALLLVYQLMFEMVNKVLLPCAERHSITSRADLVIMEALDGYTIINLPGLMIEHMKKVAEFKEGNHGLPYRFLLTKVFEFFKVPLGQAKVGTRNQSFSKITLEECECIDRSGGVGNNSTISQLINAQDSATEEIRKLKDRNAILEGQINQTQEAASSSSAQNTEVARLRKGKCCSQETG